MPPTPRPTGKPFGEHDPRHDPKVEPLSEHPTAQAQPATPQGVQAAEKDGKMVYSAKGVDLFYRTKEQPNVYTLLRDDHNGNKAGDILHLSGPDFDKAAALSAKGYADAL